MHGRNHIKFVLVIRNAWQKEQFYHDVPNGKYPPKYQLRLNKLAANFANKQFFFKQSQLKHTATVTMERDLQNCGVLDI
jgi:hypothetical protein